MASLGPGRLLMMGSYASTFKQDDGNRHLKVDSSHPSSVDWITAHATATNCEWKWLNVLDLSVTCSPHLSEISRGTVVAVSRLAGFDKFVSMQKLCTIPVA